MAEPTDTPKPQDEGGVALPPIVRLIAANHNAEELVLGWLCYRLMRNWKPEMFSEMARLKITSDQLDQLLMEAILKFKPDSPNAEISDRHE